MGCIVVCVHCSARPYGNAIKHILSYLIKSYVNGSKVSRDCFPVMLAVFFYNPAVFKLEHVLTEWIPDPTSNKTRT